jgi:predicted secreted protein
MNNILKKIIIVPHCFISKGFSPQFKEDMDEVMEILLNSKSGIVQMPCPHLIMSQEACNQEKTLNANDIQFDSERLQEAESLYSNFIASSITQVDLYKKQGVEIAGLLGISSSPTCALKTGGKNHGQGAFMDIVKQRLEERNIYTSIANIDIPLGNNRNYK